MAKVLGALENLHLAKIHQTEAQAQLKEDTTNKEKSNEIIKGKIYIKSTEQAQITSKNRKVLTKQSSHGSPIYPPKTIKID